MNMKQIKDYPNYTVGKDGKVVSYKFGNIRELKPQLTTQSNKKYLSIGLYNSTNRRNSKGFKVPTMKYLHRIVWETYMGEIPEGYEVDHIDGNPHNCSLDNLQVVTHRENCKKHHKGKLGYLHSERREEILQDYIELKNYNLVAEKWGCSVATIYRVIKNRRYCKGKEVLDSNIINDKFTETDLRTKDFKSKNNFKSSAEWKKSK